MQGSLMRHTFGSIALVTALLSSMCKPWIHPQREESVVIALLSVKTVVCGNFVDCRQLGNTGSAVTCVLSAGEYALAAELYREVLRSSEEHKGKLKTDSLQVREA